MYGPDKIAEVTKLNAEGLTISAIARETGVSRFTVSAWLKGNLPRSDKWTAACPTCGAEAHDFSEIPEPAYAYLLAMYLGDGCIVKARRVFRLRITLDVRYPGIISECASRMRETMPGRSVLIQRDSRDNCCEVGCYAKAWPCLFPQHGPGRKHQRRIRLARWQDAIADRYPEQIVRGFIHSDGCRFLNRVGGKVYTRYMFDNRSADIRALFCDACDRLDIPHTWSNRYTISIARARGVARLDELVGPKA
jgi:Helix-turn-helix domain of resolvase